MQIYLWDMFTSVLSLLEHNVLYTFLDSRFFFFNSHLNNDKKGPQADFV